MSAGSLRLLGLCLLGLASLAAGLCLGAVPIPLHCAALALGWSPIHVAVAAHCPEPELISAVLLLRVPRVLLAACIGSGLSLSGAAMQSLFRNPLVDPALIGVSSGAALLAALFTVLGGSASGSPLALTLASFVGGLLAALAVGRLAQVQGRVQVPLLILAGVAINALCGALIGLLSYIASDAQLRSLTFWTLGSVGGASWPRVVCAATVTALGALSLLRAGRALHVLVLGDAAAAHLGIESDALKVRVLLSTVLLVSVAVALCGIVGFVGLMVPHIVRLLFGFDPRRVLPASALGGAILLVCADLVSRTIAAPAELPLGTVTAAMGSPFFLLLLWRERARWLTT
jgi:iron complex transport system permease protein